MKPWHHALYKAARRSKKLVVSMDNSDSKGLYEKRIKPIWYNIQYYELPVMQSYYRPSIFINRHLQRESSIQIQQYTLIHTLLHNLHIHQDQSHPNRKKFRLLNKSIINAIGIAYWIKRGMGFFHLRTQYVPYSKRYSLLLLLYEFLFVFIIDLYRTTSPSLRTRILRNV